MAEIIKFPGPKTRNPFQQFINEWDAGKHRLDEDFYTEAAYYDGEQWVGIELSKPEADTK